MFRRCACETCAHRCRLYSNGAECDASCHVPVMLLLTGGWLVMLGVLGPPVPGAHVLGQYSKHLFKVAAALFSC